jgi:predicted choloylglycine hydrolase
MRSKALVEIAFVGTHYEMGYSQGESFKKDRDKILSTLLDNRFTPQWLKFAGLKGLQALLTAKGWVDKSGVLPNLKEFSPSQFERLKGIAEGMDVSLNLLLGLSSIETLAASLSYVMGCTSLGVGPRRSETGSPLLAYNHDFPDFLRDHLYIRRSNPEKGYASIQLTYPSLAGSICGINSEGVALTLNHAFTAEPHHPGVPPTFLVQEALDRCRSTEEVIGLFKKVRFSCGSMATVLDRKGKMAALELARNRFGVRRPRGDISLTLNAYQLKSLQEIEIPQEAKFHPRKFPAFFEGLPIHLANWERSERFKSFLKGKKKFAVQDLKRYLSDHHGVKRGGIGTICRHHATANTIATAVLHPCEGMMEAARGFACEARYQMFSL